MSINKLTLEPTPKEWIFFIAEESLLTLKFGFQPWSEVIWSSESGTSVTCSGFEWLTRFMKPLYVAVGSENGFPSILNSILVSLHIEEIERTSSQVACLWSGLGWRVRPSIPKSMAL